MFPCKGLQFAIVGPFLEAPQNRTDDGPQGCALPVATLLLIDPNPATRSILKTLLTDAGHRVDGVASVIAARGVLTLGRPDLLIADLGHQRAAETMQALSTLDVEVHAVLLLAPADLPGSVRDMAAASNYTLIDRDVDDDALASQVSARLLLTDPVAVRPPAVVAPQAGAPEEADVAVKAAAAAVAQPAPPAPVSGAGELESLYKDVGIDIRSIRRTLLYCDLHRINDTLAGLSDPEQNEVLVSLLRKLEQVAMAYSGRPCTASRNGMAVLFDVEDDGADSNQHPFQAALEMVFIAQQFGGWLRHRFPGRGRQDFAVSVALDTGDFDLEEGVTAEQDPDLRQAITRLARNAQLGGQRGWTLTATAEAMATAGQSCSAGEQVSVPGRAGNDACIIEVSAVALDSTSSVHERIVRILQSNSALLRHGGVALADESANAHQPAGTVGRPAPALARESGTSTPAPPANPDTQSGVLEVPGYRVLRPLGKGGMAEVFLATHLATGEERVLKMLPISDGEEEQLQRFIQEYALISQIRDPNVARIFEQGFTQTHAYIAMEFLPGGELRARMKGGVAVEQTLEWGRAIAGALVAVHAKGITHRDLKPANLMFRADGSLVLADFGIAKGQSDLLNRTASGHIVGSPYYLSPEQAESRQVDARCDLYSLGIILFEMLTGKKPYRASNLSDLIRQHVVAPIPRLPEEFSVFQNLIDRLLAKRPADRIATAGLVLDALQGLRASLERTQTGGGVAGTSANDAPVTALREVYSVAVIGFDDTEKIVLNSTLGLSVRRKPQFIEFDATRLDRPDLYLVDARDLLYLQTMMASNLDRAVPTVLIGTSDFGTGWPVLKRPLQWSRVFEAFDRALREHEAARAAVAG